MNKMKGRVEGIMGNREIVIFGYDTFDAAMNMAVDEVLMERAEREKKTFIRFYDFAKKAVILAKSDHINLVKQSNLGGTELTRRISGGSAIRLDENVLSYSVIGPLDLYREEGIGVTQALHQQVGKIVIQAIAETAKMDPGDLKLGPSGFAVYADGGRIASHGQHLTLNHSFLYHGVVPVGRWDADAIERVIRLPQGEYEDLKRSPSLRDLARDENGSIAAYKESFIKSFLSSIPKLNVAKISDAEKAEVMSLALEAKEKRYANPAWIYQDDESLNQEPSFCFLRGKKPDQGKNNANA